MKRNLGRTITILGLASFFLIILGEIPWADEKYPTKPIKVLIPFAPGGGTDVTIRTLDKVMPKYLPQRLMLVNRPGGHGSIAMTELMNSKPDGYTICITASGPTTSVPHVEKVPYKLDDYIPVIQLTDVPNLLVAHPDAPFKSFQDILDYAKKHPGEGIKVAISGLGSATSHLPLVSLEQKSGLKLSVVPFKSGGEAAVAVMGNHVPVGSVDLMASGAKIKGGSLKPIAVFAPKRLSALPDTPTLKEFGYDIEASFFNVIITPNGAPENAIKILHDAFKKGLEDEEFVALANSLDLKIDYLDGKSSREKINRDYQKIGELVKFLGLGKK